jgi:hypothetical protein
MVNKGIINSDRFEIDLRELKIVVFIISLLIIMVKNI